MRITIQIDADDTHPSGAVEPRAATVSHLPEAVDTGPPALVDASNQAGPEGAGAWGGAGTARAQGAPVPGGAAASPRAAALDPGAAIDAGPPALATPDSLALEERDVALDQDVLDAGPPSGSGGEGASDSPPPVQVDSGEAQPAGAAPADPGT